MGVCHNTDKGDFMIKEMPVLQTPEWLSNVVNNFNDYRRKLPLLDMLEDSLYYPACRLNGTPVKYLSGNILSFINADYSMSLNRYKKNILGSSRDDGFKGFTCIFEREVGLSEIVPTGWKPPIVPTSPDKIRRLLKRERARPFAHWSIWEKEDPLADGADCFSFFYLGGEMNAAFQGLYNRLSIRPKVLAIIQPGAIGGEWESVESNKSFFKKAVSANPAGIPEYLLHGHKGMCDSSHYSTPCWSEYRGEALVQLDERFARLWRLG